MSFKTLMVQVDAAEADSPVLRLAASLAGRFGARLIGLGAGALIPPVTDPTAGAIAVAGLLDVEEEQIRGELAEAERRFRAAAGDTGHAIEWRAFIDYPAEALGREAAAADLLILARRPEDAPAASTAFADPADVLMRAGRPLLLVPPGVSSLSARQVVVGWRDSREAQRAAADALPFLVEAEGVLVTEVCEAEELESVRERLADIVAWLGGHGVRAEAEAVTRQADSIADEVMLAAARRGADLIVAGAYGRSRLSEWVFGGATRGLLTHATVPLLLSH
ncbi:universal stress protein [Roseomonas sp. NAR14]|uniref:Universal stress protein n=1 Tax=Roseomonas acroporae TaxID=2937791 RepID=A0A9X1YE03_9PROT|nr:universal stress protein [Roseomonas acroporae]MCK8786962.1 universal stress protein [Roseomonas acroporae]